MKSTHCQKPDDKTIPKSTTKASGTRWMDQWRVMEILFKNYGAYINHLEQLSFINSQALKWPETEVYVKKIATRITWPSKSSLYNKIIRKLSKYIIAKSSIKALNNNYCKATVSIFANMESRFQDQLNSLQFLKIRFHYLKHKTWATEIINEFDDKQINIANHFTEICYQKNGCNLNVINEEWQVLKSFVLPLIANNKNSTYLEVWKRVFVNIETKKIIFELWLFLPFTNAKLERMFLRMLVAYESGSGWQVFTKISSKCWSSSGLHSWSYTLMIFLMISVILLSILMMLLSILSVIRHLISGNNLNWLLNFSLIYKTMVCNGVLTPQQNYPLPLTPPPLSPKIF